MTGVMLFLYHYFKSLIRKYYLLSNNLSISTNKAWSCSVSVYWVLFSYLVGIIPFFYIGLLRNEFYCVLYVFCCQQLLLWEVGVQKTSSPYASSFDASIQSQEPLAYINFVLIHIFLKQV